MSQVSADCCSFCVAVAAVVVAVAVVVVVAVAAVAVVAATSAKHQQQLGVDITVLALHEQCAIVVMC